MLYEFFVIAGVGLYILLAYTNYNYAIGLLAALLPTYLLRLNIFGIPTTFLEMATWIVLLASLFQPDIRKQWLRNWYRLPVSFKLSLGIFIFSCIVSAFLNFPDSLGILKGWVITPLLWGWIVANSFTLFPLLLSGVLVSLIGFLQIFSVSRITSVYDVPNSLALFLVPLIILALWNTGVFNKIAAIIMFVALMGTRSIGGIAASLIFVRGRKIALLVIILLVFLWPRVLYFVNSSSPTSLNVRLQMWSVSLQLIKKHPIAGIGLGNFESAYQQVLHQWFFEGRPNLLPEFVFRDPHNWILSFWLNTGLLGLLSFISLHVIAMLKASKPIRLALISLLLFGLVDTIYWKNDLASLHWFLLFSSVVTAATAVPLIAKQTAG